MKREKPVPSIMTALKRRLNVPKSPRPSALEQRVCIPVANIPAKMPVILKIGCAIPNAAIA